jgi:RNase H-fold protein (predicted Holliday junction resolvase)
LHGKDLKQLNKTEVFIEKLKNIFKDKEIVWIDERFTSFAASFDFNDKPLNKGTRIDDISASLILESYLNRKR